MTDRPHRKVPVLAIAVIASMATATFAVSYARAGGLQDVGQFVQPFLKTFSGTSTGPIVVTLNRGTGTSLQGTSNKGIGIIGQTKLNNGGFTGATAVLGQDLGTSGAAANGGVGGTSTEGTGVYGISTDGSGVFGTSTSSVGVNGFSSSGYGVAGASSGTGVSGSGQYGVTGAGSIASIEAYGDGGDLYRGISSGFVDVLNVYDDGSIFTNGIISATYVAGNGPDRGGDFAGANYGVFGYSPNLALSGAAIAAEATNGDIYVGYNSSGKVFLVDGSGNIQISGLIYTSGGCAFGCAKTGDGRGRHVVSFTPAESEPTTEDFGEGQLRDGNAYVQLAADFANTIDKNATYMVFLSPEGDNRGLYVADKTSRGFSVHESQGGHSTLAFSYRIVAKRFGVAQQRLPMVDIPGAPNLATHRSHIPSMLGHPVPRPAKIARPNIHE